VAATGCAGWLAGIGLTADFAVGLAGVGLTVDFAVGLAFLGDARRSAFFAGFFLTVVVFLRVAALTGAFFRFVLVLPFAFFLVALYSLP
jgi:hypothetical protein